MQMCVNQDPGVSDRGAVSVCEHKWGVKLSLAAAEDKTDVWNDKDGSGIFHRSVADGGSCKDRARCWHTAVCS